MKRRKKNLYFGDSGRIATNTSPYNPFEYKVTEEGLFVRTTRMRSEPKVVFKDGGVLIEVEPKNGWH